MATETDIVLIYSEDAPLAFARIEEILPDMKPDWYHVKLMILQIPVSSATWILKDSYINGQPFTINGKRMRLELVACPEESETNENLQQKSENHSNSKNAEIISFADIKKI